MVGLCTFTTWVSEGGAALRPFKQCMVIFRLNVIIPGSKFRHHIQMSCKMILKLRGVQVDSPSGTVFNP
jgi:hypothetical protein